MVPKTLFVGLEKKWQIYNPLSFHCLGTDYILLIIPTLMDHDKAQNTGIMYAYNTHIFSREWIVEKLVKMTFKNGKTWVWARG